MHVHVEGQRGEAKFWLEPDVSFVFQKGLSSSEIHEAETLVKEHENEIRNSWRKHFKGHQPVKR